MVKKRELMKKRRHDQWSSSDSSSSSSDGRRCRSRRYHIRETSRANDEKPMEGMFHLFRDTVIEFKDTIQVIKVSMQEKLEQKIQMLKEEGKSVKEELRILKDGLIDRRILEEELRILKEDLKELKEGQQNLKSKIQAMQKVGCAEVDHYRASPSQRSQPRDSPKFNLQIENVVSSTLYKRETVTTEDRSGQIKVAMYDGDHRIPSGQPLASVKVQLVVINGSFNDENKVSWSKVDFTKNIIKGRGGKRLVANGTFCLTDGSCHHEGAIIMDNSQQKEFKLGVMVAVPTTVRVLEGVSNPFKVQESKTKASKKKDKKPSRPAPVPNLEQPTSTHATQHGQGPVSTDEQHSLSPPVIQDVSQKQDRGKHTEFPTDDNGEDNGLSYPSTIMPWMVEGNGQAQSGNGQYCHFGILEQIIGHSTSANSMQHGQLRSSPAANDLQAAVSPYLSAPGQDQYTSPIGCSELAHQNHSAYQSRDYTQLTVNADDLLYLNGDTELQETSTCNSTRCPDPLLLSSVRRQQPTEESQRPPEWFTARGKLQAPDLLEEAADYMATLEMQVKCMRALSYALAAAQLSLNPQPAAGDVEAEMERWGLMMGERSMT